VTIYAPLRRVRSDLGGSVGSPIETSRRPVQDDPGAKVRGMQGVAGGPDVTECGAIAMGAATIRGENLSR
jgi:hypothetical protein